jgi:hypothetical protein
MGAVVPAGHGRGDLPAHHGGVSAQVLVTEGGLHDQALAAVILVGGAGQAVAHGRPDPLVDQARSVEKTEVGQHLAGQARVAHDVGRPGAEPDLHQVAVGGQRVEQGQRPALQCHHVAEQRPGPGSPAEPRRGRRHVPHRRPP